MLKRFVAFAFSAADILIETDLEGRVSYAAGAVRLLGRGDPVGARLWDLVGDGAGASVRTLVELAAPDRRLGPINVAVNGVPLRLCGWALDGEDSIGWSFNRVDRAMAPGARREVVTGALPDLVERRRSAGEATRFAVLQIGGESNEEAASDDAFFESLDQLAELASCEGAGGRLGERTVMVVTSDEKEIIDLESAIGAISRDAGRGDAAIEHRIFDDETNLTGHAIAEALDELVRRVDASGELPEETDLDQLARAMVDERSRRLSALSTVIRGRRFEPCAQVIVDGITGEESYYELLARLPGGAPFERGVLMAEEHGIITELDLAMVDHAIGFLENGADRPGLAVNLSGRTIGDVRATGALLKKVREAQIDRRRLRFELTETAQLPDPVAAARCVEKLKKWGCAVALDDFGSGESGFDYLQKLPVDTVKLDGKLLANAASSDRGHAVFFTLLRMLQHLNAATVVERVETEAQAALARRAGATYLQGWHFGKAMPLGALIGIYKPDMYQSRAV